MDDSLDEQTEDKIKGKAEEVCGEAKDDALAEFWAAFLHTESRIQIREGWLLCSPHAGLDRPGTDITGTRASPPLPLNLPPESIRARLCCLLLLLHTSILHLSILPRPHF